MITTAGGISLVRSTAMMITTAGGISLARSTAMMITTAGGISLVKSTAMMITTAGGISLARSTAMIIATAGGISLVKSTAIVVATLAMTETLATDGGANGTLNTVVLQEVNRSVKKEQKRIKHDRAEAVQMASFPGCGLPASLT
jgi:hypothetical protein